MANSVKYYLANTDDVYLYYRLLWCLDPTSKTIIVPSTLPETSAPNPFEDYIHMRIYGDIDAVLCMMESMHRLYPLMDVSISNARTIRELPKGWDQYNIIFIGGPDFNPLVQFFDDKCPIGYRYGPPGSNEVWLYHKTTGIEYMPEFFFRGNQQWAKDHGFFLKTNQSSSNNAKLVFIGGARTWGVLGAASLVSCTGNSKHAHSYTTAKQLVHRFGSNPSLLVPVEILGTREGIHQPKWNIDNVEIVSHVS